MALLPQEDGFLVDGRFILWVIWAVDSSNIQELDGIE